MLNYMYTKCELLKLIFTCAHNSPQPTFEAETLKSAVLNELLSGVDETQLTSKEVHKIPFEYIRQVCFMPPCDDDTNGQFEEEQMAQKSSALNASFTSIFNKRYQYKRELVADCLQ